MSKSTTASKPRQRNPLPAVHGSARLLQPVGGVGPVENNAGEIRIGDKDYFVKVHATGFTLHGYDQKRRETTNYDLPSDLSSCECKDFLTRADLREDHCCKHMKGLLALIAAGKLSAPVCHAVHTDDEADTLADAWVDAEAA